MGRAGHRGGTVGSVDEAQALYEHWRAERWGWVRARILMLTLKHGEFHGDYLSGVALPEPNIVGAAVRAMNREGLIRSTGEHRASQSVAAHGRRSYVYELTAEGRQVALRLRAQWIELGKGPRGPVQPSLFN
jgi:hypothetical protein